MQISRLRTALGLTLVPAAVLLLAAAQAPAPAAKSAASAPAALPMPAGAERAARAITRGSLEAPIRYLADDLLEGRGPASRGDELARLYLQTTLELLGFQPGGPNGAWQQPFEIVGVAATLPETWDFKAGGESVALKRSEEYMAASGVQNEKAAIDNAPLVFVGYGIQAPEYQWDDFKGADVRGKVLVMLNNDPDWDPKLFGGKGRLYYGRWTYKYESAARQGAAGAIIIHTTPSAGYPWQVVQTSWNGEKFDLPADPGQPQIQVKGWTTEPAMRRLLQAAGQDLDQLVAQARSRDFKPVPLGLTTSLALSNKINRVKTANVAGLLPGSDPKLKDEVVIYTAHHDHLGIGKPDAAGDRIYNGALDNATGDAQLLAIAKAFAALPERPRRSVLILFVACEEQNLLGSRQYAEHPTFPPGKIAANINYDGGNVLGRTSDLTSIGFGKTSIDRIIQTLAARQGRTVEADQFPDRGFFYRSDQFNFAKIGVPALYLKSGTHYRGHDQEWGKAQANDYETHRYHQPSDQFDPKWTYDGMIEDAQVGFYAGLTIAHNPILPVWNRGDEFEAARLKALAAVSNGTEGRAGR
ncbi:MAG TPA: M28 family metallopeptidase [Thermoanaerobaculia bacterium]|nr:M28 family metallopeptidase [Thermoanaerobaculia bacterium]